MRTKVIGLGLSALLAWGGVKVAAATPPDGIVPSDGGNFFWAAPSLDVAKANKEGTVFFFPDSVATASAAQTATIGGAKQTNVGQASFSFRVKVLKGATADGKIGEVEITGGYIPHNGSDPNANDNLAGSPANVPEFVWAKVGSGHAIYKVVRIAAGTFANISYHSTEGRKLVSKVKYGEIILPPSGIEIADVPDLGVASTGTPPTEIKIKIVGTWQKTHFKKDNDDLSDKPTRNEGSLYFGYQDYVDGAEEVANTLRFTSTSTTNPDKRDLEISKADLKNIVDALAKVTTKPADKSLTLELGSTHIATNDDMPAFQAKNSVVTLKLGADAFAAEGLAEAFNIFRVKTNVSGDLGHAGIAKLRAKDKSTETKYTLDLNWATLHYDDKNKGLLSLTGEGLFANTGKSFDLTLVLPPTQLISATADRTPLPPVIGKDWFKGTKVTFSSLQGTAGNLFGGVKTIGESAFASATVTFGKIVTSGSSAQSPDVLSFSAVTSLADSAFAKITFTSPNQSFLSLSKLSALTTIGKDVFAGTSIYIGTDNGESLESVSVISLPFKSLTSAPANVFNGAKFMHGTTPEQSSLKNLKIEKDAKHPASTIDKDAFKDFTVYVSYEDHKAWSEQLAGTAVKYYGFTAPETDAEKEYIRIIDKNGREQTNAAISGKTVLDYHFDKVWTLSLMTPDNARPVGYYRITGPAAEGFTTAGVSDITSGIEDNGIDLPQTLHAGLYVIEVFFSDLDTSKAAATRLLEIQPSRLDASIYSVTPVPIIWGGSKEAFEKALKAVTVDQLSVWKKTSDSDNSAITLPNATVSLVSGAEPDKAGFGINDNLLELKVSGNLSGSLPVPVDYKKLALTKDNVSIKDVPFSLQEKTFKAKEITVDGILVDIDSTETKTVDWVKVEYPNGTPSKTGNVIVQLIGHGALTDTLITSYQITADWASKAVINTEEDYFLGQTLIYNGAPLTHFNTFVSPLLLSEEEYKVVAIAATDEALNSLAGKEEKDIFTQIADTGSFDFYLIPTDKDTYGDAAAYVGNLTVKPLELDDLIKAAQIIKAGDNHTVWSYTIVFDPKTFVGEFGYTFANDTFTVTLSDEQAASISGLEGNTFFVTVPVNDPAKLSIKYPTKYETGGDRLYILVGDEFDLSTIVFADANAKVDFKDGLVYKSSKENKLEVEGSILTALDEWNGTITVSYLNADFDETVSATIEVSAVYDADEIPEDTGNEAVTGVSKGIGYADGSLELKGFGGEIASVYGLNGGIIVSFAVDSDDASFLLNLPKGFYVVKAGAEVSKFIVK